MASLKNKASNIRALHITAGVYQLNMKRLFFSSKHKIHKTDIFGSQCTISIFLLANT